MAHPAKVGSSQSRSAKLPKLPAAGNEEVYDHICEMIECAEEGDSLDFCSTSTFFGYYSEGAQRFEKVCELLESSKDRGCAIRLIVDVGDEIDALAARALGRFLKDEKEIKSMSNHGSYFILLQKKGGSTSYIEFNSRPERPHKYLEGRIKPFKDVCRSGEDKARFTTLKTLFNLHWESPMASPIVRAMFRHSSSFAVHRLFYKLLFVFTAVLCGLTFLATLVAFLSFYYRETTMAIVVTSISGIVSVGGSFAASYVLWLKTRKLTKE